MNTADALKRLTIGESLVRFRKTYNLKSSEIADKIGVSRQSYSSYERDIARIPADTLMQIAITYNVTTDYLLGLVDYGTKIPKIDLSNAEVLKALAVSTQDCHKTAVDAIIKILSKYKTNA